LPNRNRPSSSRTGLFKLLGWGRFQRETIRLGFIVRVLAKYGFAEIGARLGLDSIAGLRERLTRRLRPSREVAAFSRPQRLTRALIELGPTFVKLGQLLSTRPDSLPPDYLNALSELQDRVPGMPAEEVLRTIAEDLGKPASDVFAEFNPEPVAAASLAQVHRARLKTGEDVAVKVQRPDIREIIEGDLAIMERMARLAERRTPEYALYNPVGLVRELGRSLRQELDYIREGQNCDICRRNFQSDEDVFVPRMFWDYCGNRVLTMEYVDGIKISDVAALDRAGIDRMAVAGTGCRAYLTMVFDHGFFQVDPHPGNQVALKGQRLGIFDFGMYSRIDEDTREQLIDLLLAAYQRRSDTIVRLLLQMSGTADRVDEARLRNDIQDLLDRYYGVELKQIAFGQVLKDLLVVTREHQLSVRSELTTLMRGLATVEGTGLLLCPEFNFVEEMRPFLEKLGWRRFGPHSWLRTLTRSRADIEALLRHLPADARTIIEFLRRGEIKFILDRTELRDVTRGVERSTNQLSAAIVLAAIIVGASLLVVAAPTGLKTLVPIIGIAGFVLAGVLGLWLLYTVLRGGRKE
jgi:ubiquinone biosynthesis protein